MYHFSTFHKTLKYISLSESLSKTISQPLSFNIIIRTMYCKDVNKTTLKERIT